MSNIYECTECGNVWHCACHQPPPAERPREWWIGQMVDDDTWVVFETKKEALQWYEAIFHEGHIQHLIELSAFERVVAERDQLDREVCYQVGQKAEALKERDAARAENEELMKVDYWQDRYKIACKERDDWRKGAESEAHHADCDRKEAAGRIAELEKQLAEAKDTAERHIRGNLKGDHYTRKVEIERDRYRAALEFYADPEHWTIDWVEGSHGDYGTIAREALKEKSE